MPLQVPQVLHDRCSQKNGFKRFFTRPASSARPAQHSCRVGGVDKHLTAPSPGRYPSSALSGGAGMLRAGAAANCWERRRKMLPFLAQTWSVGKAGPSDPTIKPPQCQERLESSTGASQWSGYWLPKILHPSIPPPSPRTENYSGKGLSLPYCSTFIEQRSPPA